jgi:hypothetical protein
VPFPLLVCETKYTEESSHAFPNSINVKMQKTIKNNFAIPLLKFDNLLDIFGIENLGAI